LVLTTLTKEALPVLRYRTGDISALDVRACICGRTTARMQGIRGRSDDMLIIRGVNLYPSAVERVLLATGGTAPHYQLTVERVGTLDQLTLHCEVADPSTGRDLLGARLQTALRETTGLTIAVDVRTGGSLPRSEGKASRVIDKRPH
jgi:phenylacetate-CoA ligase